MQITVTFSRGLATGEASLCRIITLCARDTAAEEAISACSPSSDTSGDIPLGRKICRALIAYACRISAR